MTTQPLLVALVPVLLAILFALVKVGFLIWVFIRTQKVPAICYAVYLLLASVGQFLVPALIAQTVGARDVVVLQGMISAYGAFTTLIETVLFIWLVRSLLKSPRPDASPSYDS